MSLDAVTGSPGPIRLNDEHLSSGTTYREGEGSGIHQGVVQGYNMNKYVLSSERKYPNGVMDDAHE